MKTSHKSYELKKKKKKKGGSTNGVPMVKRCVSIDFDGIAQHCIELPYISYLLPCLLENQNEGVYGGTE